MGKIDNICNNIINIRTGDGKSGKNPHKIIFILTLIEYFKKYPHTRNEFPLSDELEKDFGLTWKKYLGDHPPNNAIEHPFYHLQNDGFWNLHIKSGCEHIFEKYKDFPNKRSRLTKRRLRETVNYGYLNKDFFECFKEQGCRVNIQNFLVNKLNENNYHRFELVSNENSGKDTMKKSVQGFGEMNLNPQTDIGPNPFVTYLNSLHSLDAGNENAMAESQACNPDFSRVHVEHPLAHGIAECLSTQYGKSVILTGHAGDGKSTLALSVYKKLKGLEPNAHLLHPLDSREDINLLNGTSVAVIKDLSEWTPDQRYALLDQITQRGLKALLISNTGALFDTFCEYAKKNKLEDLALLRERILKAMDTESENFDFGNANFWFHNLAMHDNLDIARKVFSRMLSPENWTYCANRECRHHCPIYINVQLFREKEGLAQKRVFLAYRRMYEYGTRLTMRQFTAHLAYMITAGLEYRDIRDLMSYQEKPALSDYLFYNRFFGDDGRGGDNAAIQMPVVQAVRSQGFGESPCPKMERHLWLLTHHDMFHKQLPPVVQGELQTLRRLGARMPEKDQDQKQAPTPDQAREQARRLLYFLYRDKDREREKSFLQDFLGSLSILRWMDWQKQDKCLSLEDDSRFRQKIFHVLQEQFTGVRLTEIGGLDNNNLYITLNRMRQDIRQSAQVVLAQIDFSRDFRLTLTAPTSPSQRRDLALIGQGWLEGINLELNLPLLDYVLARHHGQVGEALQATYANRLELLKAELIERCQNNNDEEMVLIRLRTNHTFRRQHFKVTPEGLEVSNA